MESFLKTFDLTLIDGQMILVGAAVFLLFWKLFDTVVFRHFVALTEAREALTSGALTTAHDTIAQAKSLTDTYNQKIFEARAESMKEKLAEVARAKTEGASLISQAEDHAQEEIRKQRWEAQQDMESLRANVMKDADEIARVVVEKVKKPGQTASA